MRLNSMLKSISVCLLIACTSIQEEVAVNYITEQGLKTHIEVLASDAFQGRAPATKGEELSVEYLSAQFKKAGLKPAFGNSYVQQVPVRAQKTNPEAKLTFSQGKSAFKTASYQKDFMAWISDDTEQVSIDKAELVYVGYGIQAPEEDWDDYKGMDVRGKILVIKNNDPYTNPDKFGGNTRLYYGRYDYKYEIGQKLGALGVLIIHTTPTAGYPWSVVANSWSGERFTLKESGNEPKPSKLNGWITYDAAQDVFKKAGLNLAELMDGAESPDFKPVPLKNISLSTTLKASYRALTLKNVGGLLEGNDKHLKKEVVLFTAHHDHLGMGDPVNGDAIYNGARDNASGTSALINMAEAFTQVKKDIRRTALFLAVGGEEQGLLGSKYYAQNPTFHPGRMAANLNMDAMNIFGRTKDVVYIGYGRSDIDAILDARAIEQGRYVTPDPAPELGSFYRSDHFSFAKIGVPAMYLGTGREFIDKPEDYVSIIQEYTRTKYHTVHDQIDEAWDFSGMVEDARLIFLVGYDILNAETMRSWNPGDEFEAARLEALKSR